MHIWKSVKMIVILFVTSLSFITPVKLFAQNNFIINGGAEDDPLVLTGWTNVSGAWAPIDQNTSGYIQSHSGTYFFFPGHVSTYIPGLEFKLTQVVNISSLRDSVDKGVQKFVFNAYRLSYPDNPPDTTQITIEFLDEQNVVLSQILLPKKWNTIDWEKDDTTFLAPALSRYIQINLISFLAANISNDGYYDDISLRAVVTPNTIQVFDVVTPNHDGKNDYFKIDGIENFPTNYVKVINESGQLVFEKTNYTNDWYCEDLPAGIYFYYIEAGENDCKGKLHVIR